MGIANNRGTYAERKALAISVAEGYKAQVEATIEQHKENFPMYVSYIHEQAISRLEEMQKNRPLFAIDFSQVAHLMYTQKVE